MKDMHRHLDDELRALRHELLEMADLVDEQFADGLNALLRRDTELARRVRKRDDEVDLKELVVDEHCERILALHQPVAADLRFVMAAIKINTDLERIGDHCKNLGKSTHRIVNWPDLIARTQIEPMADAVRAVLRDALNAFVQQDSGLARQVLSRDEKVDALHRENFDILVRISTEEPECSEPAAHLITISKALERISDHAMNIVEDVIFLNEGVDVRHRKLQQTG